MHMQRTNAFNYILRWNAYNVLFSPACYNWSQLTITIPFSPFLVAVVLVLVWWGTNHVFALQLHLYNWYRVLSSSLGRRRVHKSVGSSFAWCYKRRGVKIIIIIFHYEKWATIGTNWTAYWDGIVVQLGLSILSLHRRVFPLLAKTNKSITQWNESASKIIITVFILEWGATYEIPLLGHLNRNTPFRNILWHNPSLDMHCKYRRRRKRTATLWNLGQYRKFDTVFHSLCGNVPPNESTSCTTYSVSTPRSVLFL